MTECVKLEITTQKTELCVQKH